MTSPLRGADPAPLELKHTIQLKGPEGKLDHFALDTKRDRLLVANQIGNTLDIVDLKAGQMLRQIPDQKSVSGVAYVPDLDRIFVGNGGGVCNVFDGESFALLKSLPFPGADNVRFDARTNLIYLGHKQLAVIDPKTMTVKFDLALNGSPRAFRSEPDRPRLYSNTSGGVVAVIDIDSHKIIANYTIKLSGGNYALALDPANRRVFVGCRREPKLVVIDSETGREITSLDIPGDVDDLAYDAKRKRIYGSCGEGFLFVIEQTDPDHYKMLAKIRTAKLARTSLFDPKMDRLYLGVPRQAGKDGPEIRVYQAQP
jgi:DNA-binding beta-propeller fold protein YncE